MKQKIVAAAITVAAVVAAPMVNAKPVNELGQGCTITQTLGNIGHYTQSFKPTFSILKNVKFALWIVSAAPEDAIFLVQLRNSLGNPVALSGYGVLDADTTEADAIKGGTVTFAFANGFNVVPNETYYLELYAYAYPSADTVYACVGPDFYSDGASSLGGGEFDFEFAALGSGPAK